jgi:hypothetical protein
MSDDVGLRPPTAEGSAAGVSVHDIPLGFARCEACQRWRFLREKALVFARCDGIGTSGGAAERRAVGFARGERTEGLHGSDGDVSWAWPAADTPNGAASGARLSLASAAMFGRVTAD